MGAHCVRHGRDGLIALAVLAVSVGARCQSSDGQESLAHADLQLGYQSYMAHCAACHGDAGGGDGPLAEPLAVEFGVAPVRLDPGGQVRHMPRAEVREVIVRGGVHTGRSNLMPAWDEELEPAVVDATTDYVMAMARSSPMVPEETLRDYFASPPGVASDGRRLYVYYCSACHGAQGEGDGAVSPTLTRGVRPRDLTNTMFMQEKTDQDLYAAIALGGQHAGLSSPMPGWTYELSPEQIRALVAYMRVISETVRAD